MARSSHAVRLQRISELFTWMLLGPWEQFQSNGHPASRYFRVLELAAASPDHDIFVGEMPTAGLFDRLDLLGKSPAWKTNLAAASAAADRRNAVYSGLGQRLTGGYFNALFSVAATWHYEQQVTRTTFRRDPESYAHPLRYLSENHYPVPFVETRFGSMAHIRDDPLKLPNHRAITAGKNGELILSYISQRDERPTQSLDDAVSTRILTHMVDFLFADEPILDDLYGQWCRSQIEELIGKTLVSVY
jgi:hypothetical protein